MIFRRPAHGRTAGQHGDGGATAPNVLVFANAFDQAWQQLADPLEWLRAHGAINFSAYSQSEVEAGGAGCWVHWIRDREPVTVILARPGLPGDEDILSYCHNRGIAVVCWVEEDQPTARKGPRFDAARAAVLAGCDLIYAATPALAEALRQCYSKRMVVARAAGADLEHNAYQLLELATQQAQRSRWQKLVGAGRRVPALAGNVVRKLLQRVWGPVQRDGDRRKAPLRVLFVSNSFLPTLQLCFTRPVQPLADADQIAWEVLADIQLHRAGRILSGGRARWARRRIERFQPQLVVFCRYSGAHGKLVTDWARSHGVPTLYHLDDDLLNVPRELGPEKYAFHNQPARLAAVRYLLDNADVVYCSTRPLLQRMQQHGIGGRGLAASIHCPGEVLCAAPQGDVVKIGYMGIDHAHDFEVALPGLVRVLERNPQVRFELFGPIAKPVELDRFGDRVTRVEFVRSYDGFLGTFASLGWAIGICPLADTPFNHTKANNKWVEYTAVGIATVATAGKLYDECCADGCGLLASNDAEWEAALQSLIEDPQRRLAIVAAAQERLRREYSMAALRQQVQELFRGVLVRGPGVLIGGHGGMRMATAEVDHGN